MIVDFKGTLKKAIKETSPLGPELIDLKIDEFELLGKQTVTDKNGKEFTETVFVTLGTYKAPRYEHNRVCFIVEIRPNGRMKVTYGGDENSYQKFISGTLKPLL